jgi:hypothetical protein
LRLEFGGKLHKIAETFPPIMIELKVHCDCGQKYKFDVEPVDNRMPYTVSCPICKHDGTEKANALLQQMTMFHSVAAIPEAAPAAATPPPFKGAIADPPPMAVAAAAPARLRVTLAAPAQAAGAAVSEGAPPPIAPLGVVLPPTSGRSRAAAAAAAEVNPAKKPNFPMGMLGGFVGALVGSIIYYLIYRFTGVRIGLALGVGALAGWAANHFSKGEGSKELGGIIAVFVIVGIIFAQYLVALEKWHVFLHRYEDAGYSESVKEATAAVKAVPTGSEGEIRLYLAKQDVEDGEAIKPSAVSESEVKEFREKTLPEYQNLASGKLTKEQYLAQFGLDAARLKKINDESEGNFKGMFMLIMLSRVGLISMVIGAGVAYKMCTNA